MAACKANQFGVDATQLQLLFQGLTGSEGHHRILFAMGEQDFWQGCCGWLPAGMGVAAAADQSGQGEAAAGCGHIKGHCCALGEAQQSGLLQGHFYG